MNALKSYVEKYGPDAGPKLYRALRSRAAYIGVGRRRRLMIESLGGSPARRTGRRTKVAATAMPLFPEPAQGHAGDAPRRETHP